MDSGCFTYMYYTLHLEHLFKLSQQGVSNERKLGRTLPRNLQPKEGFLDKQTQDRKRWKKRYFELERSQLHYYENRGKKGYGDTIRLYSNVPIKISPSDSKVILIETDTRVWNLRAESEKVASEWLTALKLHSQANNR